MLVVLLLLLFLQLPDNGSSFNFRRGVWGFPAAAVPGSPAAPAPAPAQAALRFLANEVTPVSKAASTAASSPFVVGLGLLLVVGTGVRRLRLGRGRRGGVWLWLVLVILLVLFVVTLVVLLRVLVPGLKLVG